MIIKWNLFMSVFYSCRFTTKLTLNATALKLYSYATHLKVSHYFATRLIHRYIEYQYKQYKPECGFMQAFYNVGKILLLMNVVEKVQLKILWDLWHCFAPVTNSASNLKLFKSNFFLIILTGNRSFLKV